MMKSSLFNKNYACIIIILCIIYGIAHTRNQNNDTDTVIKNLLPRPQKIEPLKGQFLLTSQCDVYYCGKDKFVRFAVDRFINLVQERYGKTLSAEIEGELKDYQIVIRDRERVAAEFPVPEEDLKSKGPEAYELTIHSDGIQIFANTAKGVLWGFMTIIQLCSASDDSSIVYPEVKILDWPHYHWRGYMLDTGRSPFSVEQIKRTIRICSAFKLNFLMLREGDDELNAVKYNYIPLGHKNPFALTIGDLSDIIEYGEKYGIVVFPEIESLGHAAAKRIYYPELIEGDMYTEYWPGFSHLRKANLKVGEPGTYKLLKAIYDELFPLLKEPLVHLGLDEVRLPKEKQAEHLNWLLPIVDRAGRENGHKMQMIVWSDAPETPPEYHDRVVRCLWVYDDSVAFDDPYASAQGINALIQPGCRQKVFMAGGSGTRHLPYSKGDYQGALRNLASWTILGQNYPNFIGVLSVQWGSNIIDEWFPNFLMAGDFAWQVPEHIPQLNPYMERISSHMQGVKDFIDPDPEAVDRPAWDGIWLNGRYWDEDIMTGQKAAPVVSISPLGEFFDTVSSPIELTCNFPNAKIFYTLDGSEPTQNSHLYYAPIQLKETQTIKARAFLPGRPASYITSQIFASLKIYQATEPGPVKPGLYYDYYQMPVLSVEELVDHKITSSGTIDRVSLAPCAQGQEQFGFVYKGYIKIEKEGIYTFHLISNDGSKLYINERELIDNDGLHGAEEKMGKINLMEGYYPIKVAYFQNGGDKALTLYWTADWFSKQEVPVNVLYRDAVQIYDIVIYGATSAGVAAALQSARVDKTVALLEPGGHIGGLTSGGLGQTDIGNKDAIGGIAREFYKRVYQYYSRDEAWKFQTRNDFLEEYQVWEQEQTWWKFEPHVAEAVFKEMLKEANVPVFYNQRLDLEKGVQVNENKISSIQMESGKLVQGKMFIDASYEGDLMARAGVSYTVGRESNDIYGETLNGVQTMNAIYHQVKDFISPYIKPGIAASGLLPGIDPNGPGEEGSGDSCVQAYCFRMCLTDISENQISFQKPNEYDSLQYELLLRNFAAGENEVPWINSAMPNRKTDINNRLGVSTDYIGQNYQWPEGNYVIREKIFKAHLDYQQGLMWTLANHPRVPKEIREEVGRWGLARDEFVGTNHWPHQLYIREARRMISDYVMTEHNCRGDSIAPKPIGLAAYTMDSHNVQRYIDTMGYVKNEGDVEVGGFPPYPISYLSIVPNTGECSNLLVPVCLSASHIAFGSIRMEPVFMVLGQSAAIAAAIAIEDEVKIQNVDYGKLKKQLIETKQIIEYKAEE